MTGTCESELCELCNLAHVQTSSAKEAASPQCTANSHHKLTQLLHLPKELRATLIHSYKGQVQTFASHRGCCESSKAIISRSANADYIHLIKPFVSI
jgi:hypothetical protein